MFRFLTRIAGFLLLAGGFAQVVIDGARSIAGGSPSAAGLSSLIDFLAPGRAQHLLESSSGLAGAVLKLALSAPSAIVLTGLAAALLVLASPVRREANAP